MMNDNTPTGQKRDDYYLYTLPDGSRRVFDVNEREDGRLAIVTVLYVCDKAPWNPDDRFDNSFGYWDVPEDLITAGERISAAKMRELTGYFLGGTDILDLAVCQLARVREGDKYAPFILVLWNMIERSEQLDWENRIPLD